MDKWQICASKLEKYSFTLYIQNALLQFETGKTIRFYGLEFDNNGKWGIQLNPSAEQVHMQAFKSNACSDVHAKCSLSVLDSKEVKRKTLFTEMHCFNAKEYSTHFTKSLRMQFLLNKPELLQEGRLTLLYTISILAQSKNISGQGKMMFKPRLLVPNCTLTDQLGTLLQDDKYSDMVVAVGDQEIKAHKSILALRSPVFAAMLDCPMVESQQNRVVITDCDYDVVKEMLHYIYTGKAPNVTKMAERLLVAADKYALDGLKAMCEQVLCETLSVETAMNLLAVAEMYNADQLKDVTNDYIKANLSDVLSTADCTGLIAERAVQLYPKKRRRLE